MKYESLDCWAFAWGDTKPRPFITSLVGYSRRECICKVQDAMSEPWRKTYRNGGRIVKVTISQRETK